MKKTLKLVLIFFGGLTGIIVAALTGFLLISKNKTFYIYDVRLVKPVEGMSGYIYTDSEAEYVSIDNQTVYMDSAEKNIYPIAVYASSSNNSTEIKITSSDTSVAKIVYSGGGCYVQYIKEGTATISTELNGVKDSFVIQVYDQIPSDFRVYDYEYYGEYAELFPNTLVSYADNTEYKYKFKLNNVSSTGDNDKVDSDLIRVDTSNIDETVFSSVKLNPLTNELAITCIKPTGAQYDNIDSPIVIQSFYYDENGAVVVEKNYIVNVHIVLYVPEFLQIEVSSTPDFDEKIVYTNTQLINIDSYTEEQIVANPSLLDNYLKCEKAENYLAKEGEKSTYNVYLTERVERLYLRFRMVYTNGTIEYLKNGVNADFNFSDSDLCVIGPTNDYYIMTLNTSNYFVTDEPDKIELYEITISLRNYSFNHTFDFDYKELNAGNVGLFYDHNDETGIYTYKYWDTRTRYVNEIYDIDGNVIDFGA